MNTKIKFLLTSSVALFTVAALQSQSLSQSIRSVDEDLEAALKELSDLRESIAEIRGPLANEVESLETEVVSQRTMLAREQQLRDNRQLGIQQLINEVDNKEEEIEYVGGLLRDFVRNFEAQVHASEKQLYFDSVENAKSAALAGNLSQKELFDAQVTVVDEALDRFGEMIGGYTFEGSAFYNGELIPGKFALVGPSVLFESNDGSAIGQAVEQGEGDSQDARIVTSESFDPAVISSLMSSGDGTVYLDGTLGGAILVEETSETIIEHIQNGGVVGLVIISLGAVTLLVGLYKFISIVSFRVPSGSFVLDLAEMVKRGEKDEALSKAKGFGGLPGSMFEEAIENSDQPRSLIEEYLAVKIIIARRKLEGMLPFIAIIAAAAPLMGLLGTVVGMIKTFKLITVFGTGDARSLSSGISEALVTTELGLIVAIPSLIIHGMLNRMARTKWGQLEQDSIVFLNDVKDD